MKVQRKIGRDRRECWEKKGRDRGVKILVTGENSKEGVLEERKEGGVQDGWWEWIDGVP